MLQRVILLYMLMMTTWPSLAIAQFAISAYTIDGGGGSSAGGAFSLRGTIGQCDAAAPAALSGGPYSIGGGFWTSVGVPPPCYADCDSSGGLSIDDFICFQTLFAVGDPVADCDASGGLSIDDFICFQTLFAIGC